jgi:hypothetical protein
VNSVTASAESSRCTLREYAGAGISTAMLKKS